MKLNAEQKKNWAKTLFCNEGLTQKDVAAKVGISPKTMSVWVEKYKWEKLQVSFIMTRESELKRLYAQLRELNTDIESKPEGKRYSSNKEADTLIKLTAAIKNLEVEYSIADIVSSFKGFNEFMRKIDLAKAQEMVSYLDLYIKSLL